MNLGYRLVLAASLSGFLSIGVAQAEEHHGDHHEEHADHGEHRGEPPRNVPPRPEPPKFQPHPHGQHPHGPMVRQHPVRVLQPRVVRRGEQPWRHWSHPEFARPVYYWDWHLIRQVTCIAEDSYGDQYPVTQDTFGGFGLVNMTAIEDQALDRCYEESGGDQSCFLATCSHF
jgi:hypothetical protein